MVHNEAAQLAEAGITATNVETAAQRVASHLETEQPWRDVAAIADDLTAIRSAYASERKRILKDQEENTEHARRAVKRRDGFSTLTADQAHKVLRPCHVLSSRSGMPSTSGSGGARTTPTPHSTVFSVPLPARWSGPTIFGWPTGRSPARPT
jgi:hypothetical protein